MTDVEVAASLTSRTYARLRDDIIAGTLEPGSKLKIHELAKVYDTGASPIREALSLLTSDRLVDRVDNRGFRVSHVSREEFLDLLRSRCWIEERALRESIALADPAWEEEVLTANFRLAQSARSVRPTGFEENQDWEVKHKRFHMALIGGCGSPIILRICEQLYDQNVRYRRLAGPVAYPSRSIADEHNGITEAALARDADRAVDLLRQHYSATADYVMTRMR